MRVEAKIEENLFFISSERTFWEIKTPVIEENTFFAVAPVSLIETNTFNLLVSGKGLEEETQNKKGKEIQKYIVQPGDTLLKIAEKFDISLETILWANDLEKNAKIFPGQKLTILPVSGVVHLVNKGETLSSIAKTYGADVEEIIAFNEIDGEKIFVGDLLIIPGGEKSKRQEKLVSLSTPTLKEDHLDSYFICPIPTPCTRTQGLHWYNAVDLSHGRCGEPVYAVAFGVVQKTGFHPVAGNYIRLSHPNGLITFYGHLARILVQEGEEVSQGEVIGYVGNTGYTIGNTGCHLHFEVRGGRNPFAY